MKRKLEEAMEVADPAKRARLQCLPYIYVGIAQRQGLETARYFQFVPATPESGVFFHHILTSVLAKASVTTTATWAHDIFAYFEAFSAPSTANSIPLPRALSESQNACHFAQVRSFGMFASLRAPSAASPIWSLESPVQGIFFFTFDPSTSGGAPAPVPPPMPGLSHSPPYPGLYYSNGTTATTTTTPTLPIFIPSSSTSAPSPSLPPPARGRPPLQRPPHLLTGITAPVPPSTRLVLTHEDKEKKRLERKEKKERKRVADAATALRTAETRAATRAPTAGAMLLAEGGEIESVEAAALTHVPPP